MSKLWFSLGLPCVRVGIRLGTRAVGRSNSIRSVECSNVCCCGGSDKVTLFGAAKQQRSQTKTTANEKREIEKIMGETDCDKHCANLGMKFGTRTLINQY